MPPMSPAARFHRAVQLAFLLFMAWVGWRFFLHARWAMGQSEVFVARPPAVEGFLPISALLAARRLFAGDGWDNVHPAGLCILLVALASALLMRKGFCGFLCPVGAVSHLLFRLGGRLGLTVAVPVRFTWILAVPKYLLLAFFLNAVIFSLSLPQIEGFLHSRYNLVADTKMLLFFLPPDRLTCGILAVLTLGSLCIPSFWCRSLCPYGALLGLFSLFSPMALRRNEALCVQCGRCAENCPLGLAPNRARRVNSPDCTGCQECAAVCPRPGCLGLSLGYRKTHRLPWWTTGALTVGLLLAAHLWALVTGHWFSAIPTEMVRALHVGIETLSHY